MSWLKKLTSGLKKSSAAVTSSLGGLFGKGKIDADSLEALEDALIAADLGVRTASDIVEDLRSMKFDGEADADALRSVVAEKLTEILAPVEQTAEDQPLTWSAYPLTCGGKWIGKNHHSRQAGSALFRGRIKGDVGRC